MRLKECYIEGFGGLREYKLSFTDGLNVINEKNGFGKTTLSVFIKSMFYGLEDTRRARLTENDRKRFLPWDGGAAGGYIVFSYGGKDYRVERTFKPKAADDTYAIYDLSTGLPTNDFDGNLGEAVFGIDSDGFERTLFLSERTLSPESDNKSVSAKLSDLVGYEFDLGSLDEALSALDERRKYYYKKGGAGKISDIKSEISDTDAEISRILRIKDTLHEREAELARISKDIDEKERQLAEYARYEREAAGRRMYKEKSLALANARAQLADCDVIFKDTPPTEAQILDAERCAAEARALKDKLCAEERIESAGEELAAVIRDTDRHIGALSATKEKKRAVPHPLIFVSVALFAAGAAIAASVHLIVGIILIAFGLAALIGATAITAKSRPKNDTAAERDALLFLLKNGHQSATPDNLLSELIALKAYSEAQITLSAQRADEIERAKERVLELDGKLTEFLAQFRTQGEPFSYLREALSRRTHLVGRVKEIEAELNYLAENYGINGELSDMQSGEGMPELATVESAIKSRRAEYTIKEKEYRAALDEVGALDVAQARREALSERLRQAQQRLFVIGKTKEHLTLAKESLTAKYLGKTRAAFDGYISALADDDPALFTMSTDFALTKSVHGVSRTTEAFSLGTREVYSLAARLALVDSLYSGEAPFVVLDDPFSHLDDARLSLALDAVRTLGEKRQIIYMTCSSARAI